MAESETPIPTQSDIDELVAFLPRLYAPGFQPITRWAAGEESNDGTITLPWPEYDDTVREFVEAAARPCWHDQDYVTKQPAAIMNDEQVVKRASLSQIRTMLTYCVRAERFGDGQWGAMIERGVIRSLLARLLEQRP